MAAKSTKSANREAPRTTIAVHGARVHNLKNISLEIPRDSLVVVTGLSGSGKSSLAFDTIYAEGQRRYMESLSSYAKRFVAQVTKPDVDFVFGLSPVISIEQKTLANNPRSTVGTMTDIASYLNLLFATIGQPHCPRTGEPTPGRTSSQILEAILSLPEGTEIELRAPVFKIYGEELDVVFTEVRKKGCRRLIVDGRPVDISEPVELDESAVQHMDAVVDRLVVSRRHEKAIKAAIAATLLVGDGLLQVHIVKGANKAEAERFYRGLCSATHHFVYGDIAPEFFVFNNPESACRTCGGLGVDKLTHPELLVPDPKRSIVGGCFVREAFKYNPDTWDGRVMYSLAKAMRFSLESPWKDLPENARHAILYGIDPEKIVLSSPPEAKVNRDKWEGQGGRLRRHRATNRAVLPPVPAAWRGELPDGSVARQGDGRAHVPRLPRRESPRDEAAVHRRRQDHLRRRPAPFRRTARVSRHHQADRPRRRCRTAGAEGDPRPAGAAPRDRPRLPELQSPIGHAVGRRIAADPVVDADRLRVDGHALRARRAEHRPAPERQRQDDCDAGESSRHRQHGDRRRARRGHDPRRRPSRRDGARARASTAAGSWCRGRWTRCSRARRRRRGSSCRAADRSRRPCVDGPGTARRCGCAAPARTTSSRST